MLRRDVASLSAAVAASKCALPSLALPSRDSRVSLGDKSLRLSVPAMGLGLWSWGDTRTWGYQGYDRDLTTSTIKDAFDASRAAGIDFFDTAEVYGDGVSEKILGQLIQDSGCRRDVFVATKFWPGPERVQMPRDLLGALDGSLARLQMESVDLYQIHGPISPCSNAVLGEALADAVEAGKTRAVGVSNFSERELREVYEALRRRGLGGRLVSNQVEFSLLRQLPEYSGLLRTCADLGVKVLAYSPLAMGRLTGKYTAQNPPPGRRGFSNYPMAEIDPLVAKLGEIGVRYGGKTPAQVALNWVTCKGAIPIPGAKNARQAQENAGALGWRMSAADVATLERLGRRGSTSSWQHDGLV